MKKRMRYWPFVISAVCIGVLACKDTPTPAPDVSSTAVIIKMSVTSTRSTQANVSYGIDGKVALATLQKLPWAARFTANSPTVSANVTANADAATTCTIRANGIIVDRRTSNSAYNTIICSYKN